MEFELTLAEAMRVVKKRYILDDCYYTPQQIKYLAMEQTTKGKNGLLSYSKPNYFLIRGVDSKEPIALGLVWSDWNSNTLIPRNKWAQYLVRTKDWQLKKNGRLFLLRESFE